MMGISNRTTCYHFSFHSKERMIYIMTTRDCVVRFTAQSQNKLLQITTIVNTSHMRNPKGCNIQNENHHILHLLPL